MLFDPENWILLSPLLARHLSRRTGRRVGPRIAATPPMIDECCAQGPNQGENAKNNLSSIVTVRHALLLPWALGTPCILLQVWGLPIVGFPAAVPQATMGHDID